MVCPPAPGTRHPGGHGRGVSEGSWAVVSGQDPGSGTGVDVGSEDGEGGELLSVR